MAGYEHRLLVITAALSQVKSPYTFSAVDPNSIMQSLIAALAGTGVPFLCTETHDLAEEVVASYLYQIHLYHWLEANDHGRFLTDNDLRGYQEKKLTDLCWTRFLRTTGLFGVPIKPYWIMRSCRLEGEG